MDQTILDKIRRRAWQAQNGYSSVRESDYARDVSLLLRQVDELTASGGIVAKNAEALAAEVAELRQKLMVRLQQEMKDAPIGLYPQ